LPHGNIFSIAVTGVSILKILWNCIYVTWYKCIDRNAMADQAWAEGAGQCGVFRWAVRRRGWF
jgi:hypothetical protein